MEKEKGPAAAAAAGGAPFQENILPAERLLLLDAGNTNIAAGCMEAGALRRGFRLATDRQKTADEYALALSELLRLYAEPPRFDGAAVSSVVPGITDRLARAVKLVTGCEPFVVRPGIRTGFAFKTENPASLGADLLADMAAAQAYPLPALVFDLGTATTLSVLDRDGAYLGGLIMAGPATGLEALTRRASQLFNVPLTLPDSMLGGCTADCLRAGALYGHAAMMDGLAARAQALLGENAASILATGGLAPLIAPLCACRPTVDEQLTLRGLARLYFLNPN